MIPSATVLVHKVRQQLCNIVYSLPRLPVAQEFPAIFSTQCWLWGYSFSSSSTTRICSWLVLLYQRNDWLVSSTIGTNSVTCANLPACMYLLPIQWEPICEDRLIYPTDCLVYRHLLKVKLIKDLVRQQGYQGLKPTERKQEGRPWVRIDIDRSLNNPYL